MKSVKIANSQVFSAQAYMIKVKFITRTPFPIGMAATNRITKYAHCIINNGINTEIYIINATYRPPTECESKNVYKGIPFRYAGTCIRSSSFILRRFNDFFDFLKSCKDILFGQKVDINFIFTNSLVKELAFISLSKIRGIKIVRELCEYPYYKRCLKANLSLKLLFPLYDGFVAISENLYQLAETNKKKSARIIKIPILIDKNDIKSVHPYKHSKPYIFHGGTLTESKDALISTIKAFVIANKSLQNSVDFIIAGPPSSDLPKIKEVIKEGNLESNVIFLGQITHDKIHEYLAGASLCILNKNNTIQNQCGFSTKLSDILLSGTTVITTYVGEAPNWLKNGESAYITVPHKPELIAEMIIKAFSDNEQRERIAMNGKKIALDNFDISIQGPRLSDFLKNLQND